MKNKKAQEEMIGLVLIIVIVAVIFLVFLGLSIRKGGDSNTQSSDVYQFLESSMEFTTECSFSSAPDYYALGELFEECYSGNNCLNDRDSCVVLDITLKEILSESWKVGSDSTFKGYQFESFYRANSESQQQNIVAFEEGVCEESVKGASYSIPAFPGKIWVSLRLCS